MDNETEQIPILKVTEDGSNKVDDLVALESPLTIILNNQ